MRAAGDILLIACYELGHQPLAVAWPAAFLARAGYAPTVLDLAVERLDVEKVRRARVVAISVPMHTALRVGVRVAARVRELDPGARLVFYGLYAALNADYLTRHAGATAVIAGEVIVAPESTADVASAPLPLARPKSSTFTSPSSVTLMFAGFRSRWTMPASWATASASAI